MKDILTIYSYKNLIYFLTILTDETANEIISVLIQLIHLYERSVSHDCFGLS